MSSHWSVDSGVVDGLRRWSWLASMVDGCVRLDSVSSDSGSSFGLGWAIGFGKSPRFDGSAARGIRLGLPGLSRLVVVPPSRRLVRGLLSFCLMSEVFALLPLLMLGLKKSISS